MFVINLLLYFQIFGPMHASRNLVVAPGGFPIPQIGRSLILSECVPEWNTKLHNYYDNLYAYFHLSASNSAPYNIIGVYDLPASVCGKTIFIPDSTGNYVETCYVKLNYSGLVSWNYGSGHPMNTVHFKTAVKHEIGHMIGLADEPGISPPDSAIMYPKIDSFPRYIRKDDIEGVCCIYGDEYGASMEQYTIVDSPRTDTVYGCYIPITVGTCSGGSFNYDSVRCGMYFQGKWIVDTKRNPSRQLNFKFKVPNTDGHIGRSDICITWFRRGNPVATRCVNGIRFRCKDAVPAPWKMEEPLLSGKGGCNCVKFDKRNIYSLYDPLGRPVLRYRMWKDIKGYLTERGNGIYFVREESGRSRIIKILALSGEINIVDKWSRLKFRR